MIGKRSKVKSISDFVRVHNKYDLNEAGTTDHGTIQNPMQTHVKCDFSDEAGIIVHDESSSSTTSENIVWEVPMQTHNKCNLNDEAGMTVHDGCDLGGANYVVIEAERLCPLADAG